MALIVAFVSGFVFWALHDFVKREKLIIDNNKIFKLSLFF